jgi:hypothetical protein
MCGFEGDRGKLIIKISKYKMFYGISLWDIISMYEVINEF